ncbi:putative Pyridoxal phosphate phosphatase-related protein [Hibiscus syriacus]|uniref:Pyridoxal phosphate phosphatase-related protein n=1 Tax=Hibiscus syriacus TaxID=106335 RepID=A0A6A2XN98_HIBSY|nr:putative Pyridoxal phosphate phosphatase-related protein [Hibiscus syriacus]
MGLSGFFKAIYYFMFGGILGFHLNDQIGLLLGQPPVDFRHFSGYIDVDPDAGRSLFYYFVEPGNDPLNRPLTVWLIGGPGCSSVGDSFVGVGPFITTKNAHGLDRNTHSWNRVSNLLFIDSPVGSGWSYSNTWSDYMVGDSSTNDDLLTFLRNWFDKFPIFKYRELYLGGIGYAGHFVANLGSTLLRQNNESKKYEFNVRGLALGNPVLRFKLDILAEHELYASKGMSPNKLYQQILKHCDGIDEENYSDDIIPWSKLCQMPMTKSIMVAFNVTSVTKARQSQFDLRRNTRCHGKATDLISGKEVYRFTRYLVSQVTRIDDGVDMCIPFRTDFYFNIPEVQKAFRGNRTNSRFQWKGCFEHSGLNYSVYDKDLDMLPTLKEILLQSVPITIFSGDEDGIMPTTGTLKHVRKLAKDMNLNLTKNEAWLHDEKEAGWMYTYEDNILTFMSVKGANHHVPMSKPSQAFLIFTKSVVLRQSVCPRIDLGPVVTSIGVQKERMEPKDMYVLSGDGTIISSPSPKPYPYKPPKCSDCAHLFMKAYHMRNAGAVIHGHGIESCLATMIDPHSKEFRITHMEMIKGIQGHGYYDELVIPIIENTAYENELTDSLAKALSYPKSTAVLVRNHGIYVWGDSWISVKTQHTHHNKLAKVVSLLTNYAELR